MGSLRCEVLDAWAEILKVTDATPRTVLRQSILASYPQWQQHRRLRRCRAIDACNVHHDIVLEHLSPLASNAVLQPSRGGAHYSDRCQCLWTRTPSDLRNAWFSDWSFTIHSTPPLSEISSTRPWATILAFLMMFTRSPCCSSRQSESTAWFLCLLQASRAFITFTLICE